MTLADKDIASVTEEHPGLSPRRDAGRIILEGTIRLDEELNDVYLVRDFTIMIVVPEEFPDGIPSVFLPGDELPPGYEHADIDGSLCLGARGEIALGIQREPSLSAFIDNIVINNLFTIEYFRKYGCCPAGERSHAYIGLLEAYEELFQLDDSTTAVSVMRYIVAGKYRGHVPCPCGSGIKLRNCHGDLIREIMNGFSAKVVADDLATIEEGNRLESEAIARRIEMTMEARKRLLGRFA